MSAEPAATNDREAVAAALGLLGVERLLLGVHDAAFPAAEDEDTGRGSQYSETGLDLVRFARELGFTGLQLGPRGETEGDSASPYEGSLFSHNTLSISLARLSREEPVLLAPSLLAQIVGGRPASGERRVPHAYVAAAHREALRRAYDAFVRTGAETVAGRSLAAQLGAFARRNADWLEPDALYVAASLEHRGRRWREWSAPDDRLFAPRCGEEERCRERRHELAERHVREVGAYRFAQLLAHRQHELLRTEARRLGLELFGDLQIGLSERDAWRLQDLLLPELRLGAPPSRTNPGGQPWGYPVLDPRRFDVVSSMLHRRVGKLMSEVDGIRIDHPHGLIDPWVYRSDGDPRVAVRAGARLRSSPDLDDLPELAPLAIARRAQLDPDPATPRHADGWVRELGPQQVERYAELFDAVVDAVRDASHTDPHDHPTPCPFACEVLSTLPYPVARVLERHRLGRFRVTQKAKLDDPSDVYRSESARPEDWILIGNHDTPPLQALLPRWRRDGELETRAHQLARLLRRHGSEREREDLAAELTRDPGLLAQACFAELFSSPARNVFVYFTDLFGFDEPYNRPGDISAANWSLRIPGDFRRLHRERARAGAALDLPRALALALGSRPATERSAELVARLDAASARWA